MMKAKTVAQFFIAFANECGELLTNLKLNKLVYYTQAWHLAAFHQPFFEEEIEAWVHGPIVPVLYDGYKKYRYHPILEDTPTVEEIKGLFTSSQQDILNDVIELYFPLPSYELEQMACDEDPWRMAREGLAPDVPSHHVISHKAMQEYYGDRLLTKQNEEKAS